MSLEILLEFYRQVNEQRRHEDTLLWQITSYTIAVISFSTIAYVGLITNQNTLLNSNYQQTLKLLIFSLLTAFLFVSWYSYNKHRLFEKYAAGNCKKIQSSLRDLAISDEDKPLDIQTIHYKTSCILKAAEKEREIYNFTWLEKKLKYSAFNIMNKLLITILVFSFILTLYHIIPFIPDC